MRYKHQTHGKVHMTRILTDSNLGVKLHKTKRKLAELPAVYIANTFGGAPLAACLVLLSLALTTVKASEPTDPLTIFQS